MRFYHYIFHRTFDSFPLWTTDTNVWNRHPGIRHSWVTYLRILLPLLELTCDIDFIKSVYIINSMMKKHKKENVYAWSLKIRVKVGKLGWHDSNKRIY